MLLTDQGGCNNIYEDSLVCVKSQVQPRLHPIPTNRRGRPRNNIGKKRGGSQPEQSMVKVMCLSSGRRTGKVFQQYKEMLFLQNSQVNVLSPGSNPYQIFVTGPSVSGSNTYTHTLSRSTSNCQTLLGPKLKNMCLAGSNPNSEPVMKRDLIRESIMGCNLQPQTIKSLLRSSAVTVTIRPSLTQQAVSNISI